MRGKVFVQEELVSVLREVFDIEGGGLRLLRLQVWLLLRLPLQGRCDTRRGHPLQQRCMQRMRMLQPADRQRRRRRKHLVHCRTGRVVGIADAAQRGHVGALRLLLLVGLAAVGRPSLVPCLQADCVTQQGAGRHCHCQELMLHVLLRPPRLLHACKGCEVSSKEGLPHRCSAAACSAPPAGSWPPAAWPLTHSTHWKAQCPLRPARWAPRRPAGTR